jgi:predicted transcriptional regulator YheO
LTQLPPIKKKDLTRRPQTRAEEQMILGILRTVVEGLEEVVGPSVELVVHDVRNPRRSTFAIANGHVTGRQVGDPIIASPRNDKGFSPLLVRKSREVDDELEFVEPLGIYKSHAKDGRELKSTTIVLRNSTGEVFATVCANADLTVFQLLQTHLQQIFQPVAIPETKERGRRPSVDELIEEIIAESLTSIGKPVVAMDKDDKVKVIEMMLERGLFVIKGSAEKVASRLGVTRFTVYNYLGLLKEVEQQRRKQTARRIKD